MIERSASLPYSNVLDRSRALPIQKPGTRLEGPCRRPDPSRFRPNGRREKELRAAMVTAQMPWEHRGETRSSCPGVHRLPLGTGRAASQRGRPSVSPIARELNHVRGGPPFPPRTLDEGGDVSQPVIFISTHTIKEGKLDDFDELNRSFVEFVEAYEPRVIGLHVYMNEAGTEASLVQIHPDADSMEYHLQVAGAEIRKAFEVVDNKRVQIYGGPGARTRELLQQIAATGVPVSIEARPVGGFARPAAA
jgi:hypothetical protein